MKRKALFAGYITMAMSVFSLPAMAEDMLDSSLTLGSTFDVVEVASDEPAMEEPTMDDVTIRVVEEDDSSSAAVLSLPANAAGKAVERAEMREGYGLSKANSMLEKHSGSMDGLAEAISIANEHAKEALQNAMDARDMHNNAAEAHGMAGSHGKAADHNPNM